MRLSVEPLESLVDDPIAVAVDGLPAGERVELTARFSLDGAEFESHATFVAPRDRPLDLAVDAPVAGTWDDADPLALFWSASAVADPMWMYSASAAPGYPEPIVCTLTAQADGHGPVTCRLVRHRVAPDVARSDVRESGLVASYYVPAGDGPFPTILAVGGSDGGLRSETRWAHFASHGFATLVVAYFGVDALPPGVAEFPTEYFSGAIDWLERQETADTTRLGMTGISWGGQLTLLMASVEPRIRSAVAWVPSPVCWCGFGYGADGSPVFSERSSWTHGGRPLPYLRPKQETMDRLWERLARGEDADFPNEVYGAELDDPDAVAAAIFPLERINGPVLLISGDQDEIWPSTRLCDIAVDHLERNAFPHRFEHLRYAGAGHMIYVPERPGMGMKFTGSAFGPTARASRDAWQHALAFFRTHLD